MKCFICKASLLGFIGRQCDCSSGTPPVETPPQNAVVINGTQIAHDGVPVVHNGG